jgi:protein gp37
MTVRVKNKRLRIFSASLADVFDAAVPEQWRRDLFELIAQTPELDWQILTKRIELAPQITMSNVWLGVSVENQKRFEECIELLLANSARIKSFPLNRCLVRSNWATMPLELIG